MDAAPDRASKYQADSLSLIGAIALGTGVMIGAGIFALTGQMAEMTGGLFPLAFLSAALIVSASAYSYIKLSNAYPSAGGIAMYLEKAYGRTCKLISPGRQMKTAEIDGRMTAISVNGRSCALGRRG